MRIRNRFLFVSVVALGILILGAGVATAVTSYSVQPGDSMFSTAQKFGVPLDTLQSTNGIWSEIIHPGDTLVIPNSGSGGSTDAAASVSVSTSSYSSGDIDLLARLVYSEARGETYEGKAAVAAVALNRLECGRYGNTLADVIFEPWAFTATYDGQFWLEPDQTSYQAARAAFDGWDPSGGALYYFNPATATSPWIWSRTITGQIGNHLFGF